MLTKLFLIRHGATAANIAHPYTLQGSRPDHELVAAGIDQAIAAGEALADTPIAHVYCSPLRRARHTAEIIATKLGVELSVVEGLIEVNVGQWAGLTWQKIEERWPREHREFHEDAERHGYLGGENLAQVRERILPVIERLVSRHGGETLAIVGHGVVNRVLLAHWLDLPLRHARSLPQDNAGISLVEFHQGRAKVKTINANPHFVPQVATIAEQVIV